MNKHLLIIFSFILIVACTENSGTVDTKTNDSLNYEMVIALNSFQNCDPDSDSCSYISFTYPQISNANKNLQDSLLKIFHTTFNSEVRETLPIDSIQQKFIHEFASFKKEYPQSSQVWKIEKDISIQMQNPRWITLRINDNSYTGGAHPNNSVFYKLIHIEDGRTLNLIDFFDSSAIYKLTALAEPIFCTEKKISPNKGMDEAGFIFPNNHFCLNNNFYLDEKGITFHYNNYEIAPYVKGETTITIPADEFIKWLKPYKQLIKKQ